MKKPAKRLKKSNILTRLLALSVTAALLMGALALVVYRDRFNLDTLKYWITYNVLNKGETGRSEPFTHAGGDRLNLAFLNSGVLLASDAGAHYYSFSGERYAEEVRVLDNPVLTSSRTAGVVYDAGGEDLFLFRNREELFRLTGEDEVGEILSARVNDSGWLAVTAQQSGFKGAVTVYSAVGKKMIQISLSSTFLVDAAVSPDCKTVAVITMDQEGGRFRSQAYFFPIDQKEPRAQADLGSIVVLDLDYEEGRLWVLGESQLSVVPDDGGDPSTYSFGHTYLKGCSLGGDGFALLLTSPYQVGGTTWAQIINGQGELTASQELNGQVLDYDCAGEYCAILTGSGLRIYGAGLEVHSDFSDTQGARYTALSASGSALLADDQRAWLYIPQ